MRGGYTGQNLGPGNEFKGAKSMMKEDQTDSTKKNRRFGLVGSIRCFLRVRTLRMRLPQCERQERAAVILELGELGHASAAKALLKDCTREGMDEQIRDALVALGPPAAHPLLFAIQRARRESPTDLSKQGLIAAVVLAVLTEDRSTDILMKMVWRESLKAWLADDLFNDYAGKFGKLLHGTNATATIRWLIEFLNDYSVDVHLPSFIARSAAYVLEGLGTDSLDPLIAALACPDRRIRFAASEILGVLRHPVAIEPLLETARKVRAEPTPPRASEDYELSLQLNKLVMSLMHERAPLDFIPRSESLNPGLGTIDERRCLEQTLKVLFLALAMIGEASVPALSRLVQDETEDGELRYFAAHALGSIWHPDSVAALKEALRTSNGWIAAGSLARVFEHMPKAGEDISELADDALCEALRALLEDEYWAARENAAKALGQARDSGAVEALTLHLKEQSGDGSTSIQIAVAQALADIGDPRSVAALLEILESDQSRTVEAAAARALGKLRDPRAIHVLMRMMRKDYSNEGYRFEAAKDALCEIAGSCGFSDASVIEELEKIVVDGKEFYKHSHPGGVFERDTRLYRAAEKILGHIRERGVRSQ